MVLGRTVSLDGHQFRVIGVTPPSFFGVEVGNRYDLSIPLCADRLMAEDGKGCGPLPAGWWLALMGRLKPGLTVQNATAQQPALSPAIMRATLPPQNNSDVAKRFLANRLEAQEAGTGRIYCWRGRPCANLRLPCASRSEHREPDTLGLYGVIAYMVARRRSEIGVRMALGADRGRIIRLVCKEAVLLLVIGLLVGTALALAAGRAASTLLYGLEPNDLVSLAAARALLAAVAFVASYIPARRAAAVDPIMTLRSE